MGCGGCGGVVVGDFYYLYFQKFSPFSFFPLFFSPFPLFFPSFFLRKGSRAPMPQYSNATASLSSGTKPKPGVYLNRGKCLQ